MQNAKGLSLKKTNIFPTKTGIENFQLLERKKRESSAEPKMEEKHKVPKILVPKIDLDDETKKSSPADVIVTPMGRGRLQKQSSARFNCLCSPTTHAGSFRCRLHRNSTLRHSGGSVGSNLSELASKSAASIGNSLQAR
ncbi:hypothetical protein NE237_001132 [Protea cynaroides]|uniref:Uncharacterized protein n=1 Tax=Protea cynaroides TaxID=273540 RepID=A0A9Q0KTK1_9MAGN|nr:hypothetical protein NE237_001132 [Protea cynaroides]